MSRNPQLERALRASQLEQAFSFIVTCKDVQNPKPDPEIYLLVAGEFFHPGCLQL
jgi:beta-phosphoglucomutase-like phosphatase (HAD superfamily)